ncbi:hypothetical protein [uncultured Methylobacterium sp.]|jgi:hypothetical protein|nr:hypothetical protein [uncultured Methylobacterium sp.]
MKESQRAALIEMTRAVLGVSHIDEFTRFRAHRLLARLNGRPYFVFGLAP